MKYDDDYYSGEEIERRYRRRVAEINARYGAREKAILIVLAILLAPFALAVIGLLLSSLFN